METPVNSRKILLAALLVMVLGGMGSVFLNRVIFPYLSTISIFRKISFLESQAPIVITRREEIRINEGINNVDVVNQTKGSLASIFIHQGEFGTSRFDLSSVATGIVATSDGLIIVPSFGLAPSGFLVTAVLSDGKSYRAKVLGIDQLTGLAFVQLEVKNLSVIRQGFGRDVNIGEKLLAVWTNEGPANVSAIQVSAVRRASASPSLETIYNSNEPNSFLSLDRVFNEGLGAVLVNKDSAMVGLVTKIGEETKVLRSEDLKSALDNFLDDGKINWSTVKLIYRILGPDQTNLLKFPKEYGILTKFASAGLREGDFVYAVDGKELNSNNDFQGVMLGKKPGTKVNLQIIRGGQERIVEISL